MEAVCFRFERRVRHEWVDWRWAWKYENVIYWDSSWNVVQDEGTTAEEGAISCNFGGTTLWMLVFAAWIQRRYLIQLASLTIISIWSLVQIQPLPAFISEARNQKVDILGRSSCHDFAPRTARQCCRRRGRCWANSPGLKTLTQDNLPRQALVSSACYTFTKKL